MASVPIYYGSFNLNDGVHYHVTKRPIGTVRVNEALVNVARFEGTKKVGAYVADRIVVLDMAIVGTSRSNLEGLLDTLYLALSTPQQHLLMHASDNRYFVADAVFQEAELGPGQIVKTLLKVTFICQQPYAYAPSASSYDSGVLTYTQSGSVWNSGTLSMTGGGTVFSRPTITLTNHAPSTSTLLQSALTLGTSYTSLSVSALALALQVGDVLVLQGAVGPNTTALTQTVTVSTHANIGDTTIAVTAFIANQNFAGPPSGSGFSYSRTTVYLATGWQSITITQNTDSQYMNITAPATCPLGLASGALGVVTIVCDPIVGVSVQDSVYSPILQAAGASPNFLFSGGLFTINPVSTPFYISISPLSQNEPVIVDASWAWTSRWLN